MFLKLSFRIRKKSDGARSSSFFKSDFLFNSNEFQHVCSDVTAVQFSEINHDLIINVWFVEQL